MFINLRIDTFLLQEPNALEESIDRIEHYSNFIDGIFLPCISTNGDIEKIVNHTTLPLNVMCLPNLADFDTLTKLGVKRISMGNFLFDKMYNQFGETIKTVLNQKSFNSIF